MDFDFYNVNSIHGFTSMMTVLRLNTIIIWVLSTASKQPPFRIICFILTTSKNEKHPFKRVGVDEYGALEKSTDVTKLLVDYFNISMETTGGNES